MSLQLPFSFLTYFLAYLLGGLTLLPGILVSIWYFSPSSHHTAGKKKQSTDLPQKTCRKGTGDGGGGGKKGWIRLAEQQPQHNSGIQKAGNSDRSSSFSSVLKTNNNNSACTDYFAHLRHGTLFCYDHENTEPTSCQLILPIHDYLVSLYPTTTSTRESELYGRSMSICLAPKNTHASIYYLTCQRASDKEDWYFALLTAARFLTEEVDDPWHTNHVDWRDSTMYDTAAMTTLHHMVTTGNHDQQQQHHEWWHALLGRMFLGIYKTDDWRTLWHTKLKTKLEKLNNNNNTHQPDEGGSGGGAGAGTGGMILCPLELQHIHMGDTIPRLTCMTLDTFDSAGNCVISGQFDYQGDLWAVIQTDVWPFTGGGLEWTIHLRHCRGKLVLKIKPPPSNRVWVAFASMPTMDWQVTPVVRDKQIKWSVVTHLIQTKLNDLILDTLVMPNMEDVPFFDSKGRGGIFGERQGSSSADSRRDGEESHSGGDGGIMGQPPTRSKWVQGYLSRIKMASSLSALHPGSPKTAKA